MDQSTPVYIYKKIISNIPFMALDKLIDIKEAKVTFKWRILLALSGTFSYSCSKGKLLKIQYII